MKNITLGIAAFAILVIGSLAVLPAPQASAINALDEVCANNADNAVCDKKDDTTGTFVSALVNTLIFIVGALSTVAIIIGGFMYATSQGNSANVTKAKNTVIYAVLGLALALLAYALIFWVFDVFKLKA